MIDGPFSSGTVFKITPAGKEKVLYSFTGGNGDGAFPIGALVRDNAGNLYGTTTDGGLFSPSCSTFGCGTVFKISPAGVETVLYRFTGAGVDGWFPAQGLVRDAKGNLYGTTGLGGQYSGGIVFKITPSGHEAIVHSFNLFTGDGGAPLGGSLILDSTGNLYGTTAVGGSLGGGIVFKLSPEGKETILYNFALGTSDGNQPFGSLLLDSSGNLYGGTLYGGTNNLGTIFKIDTSNQETILLNFSGTDGAAPGGGLVEDSSGNLYGMTTSGGTDYYGTIFKLDPSGTETVLENFTGLNGKAPELGFVQDSEGNLYGTTIYGGQFGGGVVFKLIP